MHKVLFAAPAAAEFRRLLNRDRQVALRLLRDLQADPTSHHPIHVQSEILGTLLYMIRARQMRLLFEINDGRIIVLAIRNIIHKRKKTISKLSKARR